MHVKTKREAEIATGLSRTMDGPLQADETLDTLLQGRLKLYQSRSGYRISLDAILLACFATIRSGDKVADLGAGNGVIALMLARLHRLRAMVGIELQPGMANRAARNVKLNRMESRVSIVCGDVAAQTFKPESFSLVISNPPYRKPTSGRVNPNAEKKIARHEIRATLNDFLAAAAHLLAAKGRAALIYPAVRAIDLLTTMHSFGIEPKRLRMVHSFGHAEASLVLVEGVKGGRGGVKIAGPLVLYERDRRYTAEAQAMLAGEGH